MQIRHYIVKKQHLREAHKRRHSDILIDRPTPWKVFFSGFLSPSEFGFAIFRDEQLARFLTNKHAAFFDGELLKSNGDTVKVQDWTFSNVCKFCLEGFQYQTFLKFWEWHWK